MRIYIHIYMYIYMRIYTHMCVYIYAYICIYTHAYIIYTHIYTNLYTYMHIYACKTRIFMLYVLCNNAMQRYYIDAVMTLNIMTRCRGPKEQGGGRPAGEGCSAFPSAVAGRPDRPDAGRQPRAGRHGASPALLPGRRQPAGRGGDDGPDGGLPAGQRRHGQAAPGPARLPGRADGQGEAPAPRSVPCTTSHPSGRESSCRMVLCRQQTPSGGF